MGAMRRGLLEVWGLEGRRVMRRPLGWLEVLLRVTWVHCCCLPQNTCRMRRERGAVMR